MYYYFSNHVLFMKPTLSSSKMGHWYSSSYPSYRFPRERKKVFRVFSSTSNLINHLQLKQALHRWLNLRYCFFFFFTFIEQSNPVAYDTYDRKFQISWYVWVATTYCGCAKCLTAWITSGIWPKQLIYTQFGISSEWADANILHLLLLYMHIRTYIKLNLVNSVKPEA